MTFQGVFW